MEPRSREKGEILHLRNLNSRYIFDKLALRVFEVRNPGAPWLTDGMIQILASWLKPTDLALEWGSGRSTLWLAKRVAHLVSVETDAAWYARVRGQVEELHLDNVELCLCPTEGDCLAVADRMAPASLQMALVDGELARDQCAHRAISLLAPGGILVIDNINRYLPSQTHSPFSRRAGDISRADARSWDLFDRAVSSWRHIWISNGVTDTALWVKP